MKIDPNKSYRPEVMVLTATTDIFGNEIKVGSRVRSFDFPFMFDDGRIDGMGTDPEVDDRIGYVEGIVEAINDYDHGRGHPAYRILVDRDVINMRRGTLVVGSLADPSPEDQRPELPNRVGVHFFPPVNGTRSLFGRTFGVVAVVDEDQPANI